MNIRTAEDFVDGLQLCLTVEERRAEEVHEEIYCFVTFAEAEMKKDASGLVVDLNNGARFHVTVTQVREPRENELAGPFHTPAAFNKWAKGSGWADATEFEFDTGVSFKELKDKAFTVIDDRVFIEIDWL